MKRKRTLAAALTATTLAMVVALGTQSAPLKTPGVELIEASATQWPMLGGGAARNRYAAFAKNLPTEFSPEDKVIVKWAAKLGSTTYSSPVVVGGRVFIGTNNQFRRDPAHVDERGEPLDLGVLQCYREIDGEFLWQAVHPKLAAGRAQDWPRTGLVSTPTVEGDRLYYVSNRCELICARVEDGKAIWKLDMIAALGVIPHNMSACSPLVVGDLVFAVTSNGVDEGHAEIPAPQAPSFIAVNKRLGRVVWQDNAPTIRALEIQGQGEARRKAFLALANRGAILQHGSWSNPTFAQVAGQEMALFPGGDGWLRAYDPPTGRLLWKFDANPSNALVNLAGKGTRSEIISTPVVAEGRVYFNVGQDPEHEAGVGHLWCVDLAKALAKGRVSPGHDVSAKLDNFDPLAVVNRDSAFLWHFGGEVPMNLRKALGRSDFFGRSLSSCAVADGLLYVGDFSGVLYCFDAVTGKLHWSHDSDASSWSSPLCADGKVYFSNDDGIVNVFAHSKEKTLLASNELPTHVRSSPVAVNGTLFIATANTLYAFAKKP